MPSLPNLVAVSASALLLWAAAGAAATELDTVTVTAQRQAQPLQDVPLSVTAVTAVQLQDRGVRSVLDAVQYAPNTNLIEYSARAISNAQIRGIGGSPANPGITTYVDGVPQLNADTSSIELLDIEQIEIVRGAQGTLYGRNTLGGVINLRSWRPGLSGVIGGEQWVGNYGDRQTRLLLSGPLLRQNEDAGLAGSLAAGVSRRDGYSTNDFDGRDLDGRDARYGKAQLLYTPGERWDARLIVFGESADDGDFALQDLALLRERPHRVDHDYVGYTERSIHGATAQLGLHLPAVELGAVFGHQDYRAFETTDLDVSRSDDLRRNNRRDGSQTTQELNLFSPVSRPLRLSDALALRWQGGVFHFEQARGQDVVNLISAPYLLRASPGFVGLPLTFPPELFVPLLLLNPQARAEERGTATLRDEGYGVYLQGTLEWQRWALTLGLRHDQEDKSAVGNSGTVLPIAGGFEQPLNTPIQIALARTDRATTPRLALQYRAGESAQLYASAARGYRAGGFNAQSPPGSESYGEEFSAAYELGIKTLWWNQRLRLNAALFRIDIDDLQLNQPIDGGAGRFYIANAGSARNLGAELELALRPLAGWDLDAAIGLLHARFGAGSSNDGRDISGNELPLADPLTLNLGSEYRLRLNSGLVATVRGEYQRLGDYFYTADNSQRQASYGLVHLRTGIEREHWRAELYLRNALDQDRIPLAIPFTGIAPSGFVGESGAPRTVGAALALRF